MSASPADRTRRFLDRIAPGAESQLRDLHVEISAEAWTSTAEIVAALLTTLLLRLDLLAPTIHLCVPSSRRGRLPRLHDGSLIEALAIEHAGFASVARLTESPADEPDIRLVIGGSNHEGTTVDVAGWRVGLGAALGRCHGVPATAAFAAVLGADEVLQQLLRPFVRVRTFRGLVSLWDLRIGGADGPEVGVVDLDGVAFAACGGVASATGWSLALHQLRGAPRLVDPDVIDDEGTNLNRHLTASFEDIGFTKASLLGRMLDEAGAQSEATVGRWATEHATGVDLGVASPDHDRVRRQVQLDFPSVMLAGGTGDNGTYQVARHTFLDGACACCLWRGDLSDSSSLDGAARALGSDRALLEPYTESSHPLPDDVLSQVVDGSIRASVRGVPGRQLVEHVCATIRLAPAAPAVSAPMLAAAPGVLLAVELIKERLGARTPLRLGANTLTASIFGGPHARWIATRGKRPGCECTDDLYTAHYRRKWAP